MEGEFIMRFFDIILGRGENPDTRVRNQSLPLSDAFSNDKETITVDPDQSLSDYPGRPPIIFENGIV